MARPPSFAALHRPGDPLLLFNAWDAGSARVIEAAGAPAIATASWAVAAAHGHADGEELPLEAALANLARVVAAVAVPVTVDLEAGYGRAPSIVGETVAGAIAAGAAGFNLEDRITGAGAIFQPAGQAARLRVARAAAGDAFVNARTDLFLLAPREAHDDWLLDAAIERAKLYADAGADGFFAPGLLHPVLIERLCSASPLPVNIMLTPDAPPIGTLASCGVARISWGPAPYRRAMAALDVAARDVYGTVIEP